MIRGIAAALIAALIVGAGLSRPLQSAEPLDALDRHEYAGAVWWSLSGAEPAKIIGRIDQPAAKVMLPDAIRNRAPSEHIAIIAHPLRKCRASRGLHRRLRA